MKTVRNILTAVLTFCLAAAQGQTFSEYADTRNALLIGGANIEVLEDPAGSLRRDEVFTAKNFSVSQLQVPNLGVSESVFWLRFGIINKTQQHHLLLNCAYANLDTVEMIFKSRDTAYSIKTGEHVVIHKRAYQYPGYLFDLKVNPGDSAQICLRIRGGGQLMAPIYLGSKEAVLDGVRLENLFIGIYAGIMLIMFFYNLFVYFIVKDRTYLYYVIYILMVGLTQMCLLGYTYQLIWPNSPWLAHHSIYLLSALSCIAIIEFIKVFLHTKEIAPRLHRGFQFLTAVYAAYVLLDLIGLSEKAYNLIQLFALILSFYILIVAIIVVRRKYRPANFLLFAWISFLVGVVVYALKDVGLLPYNNLTIFMMPVGSAIETALLSFALADRINILKKEREESQQLALQALTEKEKVITEQKTLLEEKVKERTAELEASNKSLKEAEAQLVNVEKMASLGQLTAGISHEINNPINFVVSNVKPLRRDVGDILQLLEKYEELKDPENMKQKLDEIEAMKKQMDLSYLKEEIHLLLKGIDEGANRTAEIVRSLKNFSRTDEAALKYANIHEGIDATLAILNNNLNAGKIKLEKNYGTLPKVECFPGKLNQVFMNVINNAIHAVSSKHPGGTGTIVISTCVNGEDAEIRIADNGTGIPKANIQKIYDPFFTTKPVGMGTGLGLSIVYGIIKSHNGSIEVSSEEGQGTEFVIRIPLKHAGS